MNIFNIKISSYIKLITEPEQVLPGKNYKLENINYENQDAKGTWKIGDIITSKSGGCLDNSRTGTWVGTKQIKTFSIVLSEIS